MVRQVKSLKPAEVNDVRHLNEDGQTQVTQADELDLDEWLRRVHAGRGRRMGRIGAAAKSPFSWKEAPRTAFKPYLIAFLQARLAGKMRLDFAQQGFTYFRMSKLQQSLTRPLTSDKPRYRIWLGHSTYREKANNCFISHFGRSPRSFPPLALKPPKPCWMNSVKTSSVFARKSRRSLSARTKLSRARSPR